MTECLVYYIVRNIYSLYFVPLKEQDLVTYTLASPVLDITFYLYSYVAIATYVRTCMVVNYVS